MECHRSRAAVQEVEKGSAMLYSQLTAAVVVAARHNGRHTDRPCGLCAAHKQAWFACASELLPTVLGGE